MKIGPDYDRCYAMLKQLLLVTPDFESNSETLNDDDHKWLANLNTCMENMIMIADRSKLSQSVRMLTTSFHDASVRDIRGLAYRALAKAEFHATNVSTGTFIPVGGAFNFHTVLTDVLRDCKADIFLIDPYMDNVAVTDVAAICPSGVTIRFLTGNSTHKTNLQPAVANWSKQHGPTLDVRLTDAKSLHDRLLVIDSKDAFLLTQSVKDFAKRASGAVQKMDVEAGKLKAVAYEALWASAEKI